MNGERWMVNGVAVAILSVLAASASAQEAGFQKDPRWAEAKKLDEAGKDAEALAAVSGLLATHPDEPEILALRAGLQRQLGKPRAARKDLEKAESLRPGLWQVARERGRLALDEEKWVDAEAAFSAALDAGGDDAVLLDRCRARLQIQEPEPRQKQALEDVERYVAAHPKDADGLFWRGRAMRAMKRPKDAIACFDEVLALAPGRRDARLHRCFALTDARLDGAAIRELHTLLTENPDDRETIFYYGLLCSRLHFYPTAYDVYTYAISREPEAGAHYLNRGTILVRMGRNREAIDDFTQAIRFRPTDPLAWMDRAMCFSRAGDQKRALSDYETLIELTRDEGWSRPWYLTARCYLDLGRHEEALAMLEKFLSFPEKERDSGEGFDADVLAAECRKVLGR